MHIHYKNQLLLRAVALLPKATGYGIINRTASDSGENCPLPAVCGGELPVLYDCHADVDDVGLPAAEVVKAGSAHISPNKAQMHCL